MYPNLFSESQSQWSVIVKFLTTIIQHILLLTVNQWSNSEKNRSKSPAKTVIKIFIPKKFAVLSSRWFTYCTVIAIFEKSGQIVRFLLLRDCLKTLVSNCFTSFISNVSLGKLGTILSVDGMIAWTDYSNILKNNCSIFSNNLYFSQRICRWPYNCQMAIVNCQLATVGQLSFDETTSKQENLLVPIFHPFIQLEKALKWREREKLTKNNPLAQSEIGIVSFEAFIF